ncbi:MAG TPA: SMP-30/gluconolactonase/LRE family protein [Burkholderiales bacterium]|jgi:sugar lactone lactonase YvrE|nr:SMP-30/gluconolactonase/LRE family protein [Burkholderiales bacterium]
MSTVSRITLFLFASFLVAFNAGAWDRGHVDRFATLPTGAANPEGIAVDKQGNVYVATFAAGPGPFLNENLFVFDSHGRLKSKAKVAGSTNTLLGIDFNPVTGDLLVCDIGVNEPTTPRRVWRITNAATGAAQVFAVIPGGGNAGPNALAFDRDGNVYISDSFQGIVWRTKPDGSGIAPWVSNALLTTTGFPPFGANGLDFNRAQSTLFVANTGNDTVVQVPVNPDGTAGAPTVFVQNVNGADGLFVDEDDNIWVCANQADEIVVIDNTGKGISKLGDFDGIRDGSPVGLLFPASLARHGDWIYITNLSLDLRLFGGQTVDSQYAAKVKNHTIARIRARVLGFEHGDQD